MFTISRTCISFLLLTALLSALWVKLCPATEITDQDGIVHYFDAPFRKVISLYPAHTENLIEMGAADILVGVSDSDSPHEEINGIKRFSYHDSAEKFIAADPDCILIRPMIKNSSPNLVKKLQKYGIAVISLQPTSSSDLFAYWHMLGLLSGRTTEALELSERFRLQLNELNQKVAAIPYQNRPRVYFESIHTRMKTFSPQSIAIFCLTSAGGVNVASDALPRRQTNIAAYSKERILSHAASIDIFLAQYGRMNRITIDEIINEPGFGAIKAIREKQVYLVAENLVSRPTTKLIEGMLYLYSLLYQDSPQ
jgi:iron complex transport system substrate-binding protein